MNFQFTPYSLQFVWLLSLNYVKCVPFSFNLTVLFVIWRESLLLQARIDRICRCLHASTEVKKIS